MVLKVIIRCPKRPTYGMCSHRESMGLRRLFSSSRPKLYVYRKVKESMRFSIIQTTASIS